MRTGTTPIFARENGADANNDMTFDDLQTEDIFTMNDTPSYPKLKTDYGYIDMRDEIKVTTENVNRQATIRLMSFEDVASAMWKLNKEEHSKVFTYGVMFDMIPAWLEHLLSL